MEPEISLPENWAAPRELARALPREVQMTPAGTAVSVMLVLMALAAIGWLVFMRNRIGLQAAHVEMLRTEGREAPGTVLRLWHAGKSNTPTLSYAFTADGRRFEGEASAPAVFWNPLRTGDTLPIRFVPADPNISHPSAWVDLPPPVWVPYIFPLVFAVLVPVLVTNLRRQGALLADGLPALGVVTGSSRTKGGWRGRYRFRTKAGEVRQGRCHKRLRPMPGDVLCILYDPENPGRNEPYPMNWYRLA
jgi:hypothetical protein